MRNLRMLQFYDLSWSSNGTFHAFLESLPDALKFLCWENFPQRYLPQAFPENLVALEMPSSDLERLWLVDQVFHLSFMLCAYFGKKKILGAYFGII